MKVKIRKLCDIQGIKTAYQLAKKAKLKMPTAYRAFADDIKQFTPETLEALCLALQCSPNDIFEWQHPLARLVTNESEPVTKVVTSKSKAVTKTVANNQIPATDLVTGETLLTTADVASRLGLNERTVRDYYNNGKLPYQKIGSKNFVRESDFEAFKSSRQSSGLSR